MRVQKPAIASSTALSTTSYTRWCRPDGPVEPMYIPGRSRTGSSPRSTVMSLASYATKSTLFTCDDEGFGGDVVDGGHRTVSLTRLDGETPGQTRWGRLLNDTRRVGHSWSFAGSAHRDSHGVHDARSEVLRERVDDAGFEVSQRRGPHRIVDLEGRVCRCAASPDRTCGASSRPTSAGHCSDTIRIASGPGDAQLRRELDERIVQRDREAVLALQHSPIVAVRAPSTCSMRNRRSGSTPGGTTLAVVNNVCPGGSSRTNASARAASSSLNTSSSSSTGVAPVSSAVT